MHGVSGSRRGAQSAPLWRAGRWAGALLALGLSLTAAAQTAVVPTAAAGPAQAPPEVRGTWLTTTANDAISGPEKSAESMRRLREIGLNTVYVEVWKNGYTQFPSETLRNVIGLERRPNLMPQDPSDDPSSLSKPARDLLEETLIEAHRNGLIYVAWFEYGFMAAHKDTMNHLRKMKPEWLSRDIEGNEVAPNGFVWMNPLHPEARRFLLDIVLEAIDKYDLDGIQLDDRIVWPYVTMGYDDYTRQVYAAEHNGAQPPEDYTDAAWMRWRADKVNEYARQFVSEVRAARPGIVISLSPAVYPWCYRHYLLEWPKWAAWTGSGWDTFIPQVYRFNYDAFAQTWLNQVKHMQELGAGRVHDLVAGIRVVGEGPDATWDDLRKSMELVRESGGGGHVHWFSRGVLDVYPAELTAFYAESDPPHPGALPPVRHPKFPAGWRPGPIALTAAPFPPDEDHHDTSRWVVPEVAAGTYHIIGRINGSWRFLGGYETGGAKGDGDEGGEAAAEADGAGVERDMLFLPAAVTEAELLIDRRPEMREPRLPRAAVDPFAAPVGAGGV